jgi:hypothetical protein
VPTLPQDQGPAPRTFRQIADTDIFKSKTEFPIYKIFVKLFHTTELSNRAITIMKKNYILCTYFSSNEFLPGYNITTGSEYSTLLELTG